MCLLDRVPFDGKEHFQAACYICRYGLSLLSGKHLASFCPKSYSLSVIICERNDKWLWLLNTHHLVIIKTIHLHLRCIQKRNKASEKLKA